MPQILRSNASAVLRRLICKPASNLTIKCLGCITSTGCYEPTPFISSPEINLYHRLICKTPLKKKMRFRKFFGNFFEIYCVYKQLYFQLLTWSVNFARDFIETMIPQQWLLKVPQCFRSRDWKISMEAI